MTAKRLSLIGWGAELLKNDYKKFFVLGLFKFDDYDIIKELKQCDNEE